MKMENTKTKASLFLVAILVVGLVGVHFFTSDKGNGIVAEGSQTYLFANPAFAQSISSETTFLEEEAGMSIYVNIGASIDLSKAKTVYKTIEKETADYIVGSLSLPDLPETDDVHCFVHKDGWIVVYYLKAEPISKIIDWSYYSGGKLTKTKLQVGLEKMGLALGATVTGAKHYNFQYPYADKWMTIIESGDAGVEDSFNLKIPGEFTLYERSWSHYGRAYYDGWSTYSALFKIDGNTISSIGFTTYMTKYGQLTSVQLSPDVFHSVSTYARTYAGTHSVGIVLAYKEP